MSDDDPIKPLSRRNSTVENSSSIKRRKSCNNNNNNNIPNSNNTSNKQYKILPREYIKCEKTELITIISRMLSSIVKINDSRTSLDVKYLNNKNLTRFHSRSSPQISIFNYLLRLSHYSSLENCVLIATVYYIDLLTMQYPSFALNSLTVHRFLLTATTIASKALCDSFCSNNHYAKVGGVNIIELNLLEVEFLKWVNYRVVPRDYNYDSICQRKNSTGNIEFDLNNSLQFGISNAHKILDLYYEKMISLCGGFSNNNNNNNTNNTPKDFTKIGHNDEFIYTLEETLILSRYSSSSSTNSSSSNPQSPIINNQSVENIKNTFNNSNRKLSETESSTTNSSSTTHTTTNIHSNTISSSNTDSHSIQFTF